MYTSIFFLSLFPFSGKGIALYGAIGRSYMQLCYFLLQRLVNIIRYEKIKAMQHLHMLKHGYRIPTAILGLEDLVLGLSPDFIHMRVTQGMGSTG